MLIRFSPGADGRSLNVRVLTDTRLTRTLGLETFVFMRWGYGALVLAYLCVLQACGHTPSTAGNQPSLSSTSKSRAPTRTAPSQSARTKARMARRTQRPERGQLAKRRLAKRGSKGRGQGPTYTLGRTSGRRRVRLPKYPDRELVLCPGIRVSNAPRTDRNRKVKGFRPFIMVEGKVRLAVSPAPGACLSSGFGRRRNRVHKGIDFQSNPPPIIRATGYGMVIETGYRRDYGNYVLIDHGHRVFTRYAHLRARPKVKVGQFLKFGTPLGVMGNSAAWKLPVHLHYELLVGDYHTPKKSFGLKPRDPFSYPYSRSQSHR